LEGQRSSLIGQAIRLITELKPNLFIWENVKGVFSSNNGEDFWAVIQAFTNIGGYRLEWQLLNTAWFLPQNRERIYLIGHLAEGSSKFIFPIRKDYSGDNKVSESNETTTVRTISAGGHSGGNHSSMTLLKVNLKNGFRENDCNVSSTLQSRDYKGYSNQDMDYVCVDYRSDEGLRIRDNGLSPTLQARAREDKWGMPMVIQTNTCTESGGKQPYQQNRVYDKEGIIPALMKNKSDLLIANTVTPDAYLARGERNRDENGKAVLTSMHDRRIRRLTEIECERLQGFPDDWTEYGNYNGEVKKVAKTQRYKMLGNAVTVKVVEEIGRSLLCSLE
jgi:DNA (cytosine-5)-methyltransferase 1